MGRTFLYPDPARSGWTLRRLAAVAGLVGVLVATVVATGAVPGQGLPRHSAAPQEFAVGHATLRWPADSVSDWVSFADQISIIEIVDDRRLPSPPETISGGYEARRVVVRVVGNLWTRPNAPTVERFEMAEYGWLNVDGERKKFVIEDGVWLEVGERYVAPLVRGDEGLWTTLSPAAIVKLDGDVATGDVDDGVPSQALRSLKGHKVDDIRAVAANTRPDPGAERFAGLPPDARVQAVLGAKP